MYGICLDITAPLGILRICFCAILLPVKYWLSILMRFLGSQYHH